MEDQRDPARGLPENIAKWRPGGCRVRAVRYTCPLMGVWLMLSPLLLPGPYSGWVILGGAAAFGASGWAADAGARQQPSKEP